MEGVEERLKSSVQVRAHPALKHRPSPFFPLACPLLKPTKKIALGQQRRCGMPASSTRASHLGMGVWASERGVHQPSPLPRPQSLPLSSWSAGQWVGPRAN